MSKFKNILNNRYEKDLERAKELFRTGEYRKAESLFLKIYKYYKKTGKLNKAYSSLNYYISIILLLDKTSEAEPYIKDLLAYSIKNKDKFLESSAKGHLGLVFKDIDLTKAKNLFEEALKLGYELNDIENVTKILNNIGNIYYLQGLYEDALEKYNEAKVLSIKNNLKSEFAPIYSSIALVYLKLKDFEQFNENYELVFQNLRFINNPVEMATILNNSLADIRKEKITNEGFQFLKKILTLCKTYDLKGIKIIVLSNIAKYFNQEGDFEKAEKYLKDAIELTEKFNLILDKGEILNSLGYLYNQKGDVTSAMQSIKLSIGIAQKFQLSFLLLDNYILLGGILKNLDDFSESYRYFTQAFQNYHIIVSNISSLELRRKFIDYYQELPKIIEDLNDIIESKKISPNIPELSKIQKLSNETCKVVAEVYADFEFEECIKQNKRLKIFINVHKSRILEEDTRELFRKRDFFNINPESKEWEVNLEELNELNEKSCLKDKTSKTIEIDVYGKKEIEGKTIYLLGECKFKNKIISLKEIKCFIIKVNIIAQHILEHFRRKSQKEPFFNLLIVSLGDFPEFKEINPLVDKYWKLPKRRIINSRIELLNHNDFINSLKANNISPSYYIQLQEII